MRQLKPLNYKPAYGTAIEGPLRLYFEKYIFKPLSDIMRGNIELFNSKSVVVSWIRKGKIQYITRGKKSGYIGTFKASVSRELSKAGAKFDRKGKMWVISKEDLPVSFLQANVAALARFAKNSNDMTDFINNLKIGETIPVLDLQEEYEKIIKRTDTDFRKIAREVAVVPELDEATIAYIADEYTNNMNLYIKSWTESQIVELRDAVQKNAMEGYRADTLAKSMQKQYNLSMNKASFLAKQETNLLVSKLRESRFKDAGVNEYKWSTSKDSRVRDRHKELDGKVFMWDSPPIMDDGSRKNPGEDFGCRCKAIPVFRG